MRTKTAWTPLRLMPRRWMCLAARWCQAWLRCTSYVAQFTSHALVINRVRIDLGTVLILYHIRSTVDQISAGLPVCFCRSAPVQQYQKLLLAACLLWHWHVIIKEGGCSTWCIWSIPRWTSADAISRTTAGLDYQLIAIISCRKQGSFHYHWSLLDQVLTRPVQST